MRNFAAALTASAAAILFATAAEARPAVGASGLRAGGDASAKADEGKSLIETFAVLIGFSATVTVTPAAGSGASPRLEPCEEDKKRAEAAKAAETRRTAEAQKRSRGAEPVYLAF